MAVYRDVSYAKTTRAGVSWAIGKSTQAHVPSMKGGSMAVIDIHSGSDLKMGYERAKGFF